MNKTFSKFYNIFSNIFYTMIYRKEYAKSLTGQIENTKKIGGGPRERERDAISR